MQAKDATDGTIAPPSDAIDAAAAEWVIRLGGLPLSADERKALDRWLSANRQHREAFELAQRAWGELGGVALEPPPTEVTPAENPIRTLHAASPRATMAGRTWHVPATVAASVITAFCAVSIYRSISWSAIGADYYTRVGEVRSAVLPDGSTITLDTNSAVTLNFAGGARHVRLLKGTAKFDVERVADAERNPFFVEAGNRRVRALGTSFVVSSDRDNVCVHVLEHSVLVSQMNLPSAAAPMVRDGEQLCLAGRASRGRIETAPPTAVSAWEHGHLMFDRAPLRDAVAQLNRYRSVPLLIIGDSLRERPFSGLFRLEELDNAPELIGRGLQVRVLNVPGLVTLIY